MGVLIQTIDDAWLFYSAAETGSLNAIVPQ